MVDRCSICNGRVLSHSRVIVCSICSSQFHIQCLPNVTINDSIYTERNHNKWICIICTRDIFPFNNLDDDLFMNSIAPNPGCSNIGNITELPSFNSFELSDDTHIGDGLEDIDPDIQYFNNQMCFNNTQCCTYHGIDSFNNMYSSLVINDNIFSMLCSNIRSAAKISVNCLIILAF